MNVLVNVKIDQEIGQSLGKVKLHEKKNKKKLHGFLYSKNMAFEKFG